MIKLLNKVKNRVKLERKISQLKRIAKKKRFRASDNIIIFSDPRGGSTWLAEILNSIPNSFIYWEPLAIDNNPLAKNLGFGWRQHIPGNCDWKEAMHLFNQILSVSIINEWTTQKINSVDQFNSAKLPIIKICRGNHLLAWLLNHFSFVYPPIYLVRHPLAVVSSQLQQGGWDFDFDRFHIPEMRFNEEYLKHKNFLDNLESKAESLLVTWCITNKDLISRCDSRFIRIFYEDLVLTPKTEITKIFDSLKIGVPENLESKIKNWSSTTVQSTIVNDKSLQLAKWRENFSKTELDRFQKILDYFEIKTYNIDNILPTK